MAKSVNEIIAEEIVAQHVDLLRAAAGVYGDVRTILEALEDDLAARLTRALDRGLSASRLRALLTEASARITAGYREVADLLDGIAFEISGIEAATMMATTNAAAGVSLIPRVLPPSLIRTIGRDTLLQGAASRHWWARQSGDLQWRFARELRMGIAAGETGAELVRRVRGGAGRPGIMDVSRRDAEALVRSSVNAWVNNSRLAFFRAHANVYKAVQQKSTLDARTTDICIAYDGQRWDMEGNPIDGSTLPFNGGPPRHWGCRSQLVGITKSWEEMGIKARELPAGTRASMDGQVSGDWTFGDWLARLSVSRQNEILGPGRAALWREGKITLQQLLDQSGRPLTLESLKNRRSIAR